MRKKKSVLRRRWPMLTGLLVAGAVAGAVGAVAMRRREQQPWDEYDPATALDTVRGDAATIMGSSAGGAVREPASPKSSPMEKMKDRAGAVTEKISASTAMTDGAKKAGTKSEQKSDNLLGSAPSRNSSS
ncbi:hypothetical protein [Plantactinospora sonchi]|uniref:YtxH domain-containing protein n=1 Tax=Plantactinospora sonchi TaxID=1544735 RepID=A0ABU7RQ33_9ACTN